MNGTGTCVLAAAHLAVASIVAASGSGEVADGAGGDHRPRAAEPTGSAALRADLRARGSVVE